jgi:hypothetical protein
MQRLQRVTGHINATPTQLVVSSSLVNGEAKGKSRCQRATLHLCIHIPIDVIARLSYHAYIPSIYHFAITRNC